MKASGGCAVVWLWLRRVPGATPPAGAHGSAGCVCGAAAGGAGRGGAGRAVAGQGGAGALRLNGAWAGGGGRRGRPGGRAPSGRRQSELRRAQSFLRPRRPPPIHATTGASGVRSRPPALRPASRAPRHEAAEQLSNRQQAAPQPSRAKRSRRAGDRVVRRGCKDPSNLQRPHGAEAGTQGEGGRGPQPRAAETGG